MPSPRSRYARLVVSSRTVTGEMPPVANLFNGIVWLRRHCTCAVVSTNKQQLVKDGEIYTQLCVDVEFKEAHVASDRVRLFKAALYAAAVKDITTSVATYDTRHDWVLDVRRNVLMGGATVLATVGTTLDAFAPPTHETLPEVFVPAVRVKHVSDLTKALPLASDASVVMVLRHVQVKTQIIVPAADDVLADAVFKLPIKRIELPVPFTMSWKYAEYASPTVRTSTLAANGRHTIELAASEEDAAPPSVLSPMNKYWSAVRPKGSAEDADCNMKTMYAHTAVSSAVKEWGCAVMPTVKLCATSDEAVTMDLTVDAAIPFVQTHCYSPCTMSFYWGSAQVPAHSGIAQWFYVHPEQATLAAVKASTEKHTVSDKDEDEDDDDKDAEDCSEDDDSEPTRAKRPRTVPKTMDIPEWEPATFPDYGIALIFGPAGSGKHTLMIDILASKRMDSAYFSTTIPRDACNYITTANKTSSHVVVNLDLQDVPNTREDGVAFEELSRANRKALVLCTTTGARRTWSLRGNVNFVFVPKTLSAADRCIVWKTYFGHLLQEDFYAVLDACCAPKYTYLVLDVRAQVKSEPCLFHYKAAALT